MKGEQPVVRGGIPHALDNQLSAFCDQIGQSESDLLRAALGTYSGVHTPDSVDSLQQWVASLERKMAKLTQLV